MKSFGNVAASTTKPTQQLHGTNIATLLKGLI